MMTSDMMWGRLWIYSIMLIGVTSQVQSRSVRTIYGDQPNDIDSSSMSIMWPDEQGEEDGSGKMGLSYGQSFLDGLVLNFPMGQDDEQLGSSKSSESTEPDLLNTTAATISASTTTTSDYWVEVGESQESVQTVNKNDDAKDTMYTIVTGAAALILVSLVAVAGVFIVKRAQNRQDTDKVPENFNMDIENDLDDVTDVSSIDAIYDSPTSYVVTPKGVFAMRTSIDYVYYDSVGSPGIQKSAVPTTVLELC